MIFKEDEISDEEENKNTKRQKISNDDDEEYNDNDNNNDEYNDNEFKEYNDDGENDDLVNNDGEENANNSNNDLLLGQFPVHKFNDADKLEENKKQCSICMENYAKNEEIATLPCIHMFHKNCIKTWLETRNICPICRLVINI